MRFTANEALARLRGSVLTAAIDTARALRATADRIENAAKQEDFLTLAEIAISGTVWPLDKIRGAALAIGRITEVAS